MTESKLKSLVTEAVSLDREIAEKQDRLKELKSLIVAEAQQREEEHTPGDGGGSCWIAKANDGSAARVSFPVPSLKSKIDGEGKTIEKIRAASGKAFNVLFTPTISYKPVDDFRARAEAELDRGAAKLIRLCQTESSPRVSFETKEGQ